MKTKSNEKPTGQLGEKMQSRLHGGAMMLHLPLKAKWYVMQECGVKNEEYREITPYWIKRLLQWRENNRTAPISTEEAGMLCANLDNLKNLIRECPNVWHLEFKPFTHVTFRYGYTQRSFISKIDSISIDFGLPGWGAPIVKDVFVIRHSVPPLNIPIHP